MVGSYTEHAGDSRGPVLRKLCLAEITAKYVGAPYKLGASSMEEGYDCITLLLALAEDFGVELPDSFEGLTRDTYATAWQKDQDKQLMLRFINFLGTETEHARPGDILIVEGKNGITVGISGGNRSFLSSFMDIGVRVISLQPYIIRKAFKWGRDQSKHRAV